MNIAVNAMINSEQNGPGPEICLKELKRIIKSKNPPVRIIVGVNYKFIGLLKRILSSSVIEKIITKMYS